MHLLRRESNGEFSLTEYYQQPPPYAILSHTWASDSDEVTFKDILKGRGKSKSGYEKLRFCAAQAEEDGLEYFWVDTCCIDKRDLVKLTEAINSMFSWYQHSAKCYVYLSDVAAWGPAFHMSKWFTRGWTLQELLAPSSVEFFDFTRARLGDKHSLSGDIHKVTRISVQALEADPLSPSEFSIDERMSWAKGRETKRQEDAAYSLLGLFGVHMPPIYGEGRSNAFDRLRWEIERKEAIRRRTNVLTATEDPARGLHDIEPWLTASNLNPTSFPSILYPSKETFPFPEKVLKPDIRVALPSSSSSSVIQDDAEKMESWWKEAIAVNMDTTGAYEKVAVLLVTWADELDEFNAGTRKEVRELEFVFRIRFRFNTEIVALNVSSRPQHQMDRSLITFIEQNDGAHNLLIVYYTGRSAYYMDQKHLKLLGHMGPRYSVNWHRSEDILRSDEVDADVLTILDTGYASNQLIDRIAENNTLESKKRTKRFELMSACMADDVTAAPGPNSFTHALTNALNTFSDSKTINSFSTFSLNQQICMQPRRRDTPSMIWSLLPNKSHIFLAPMRKPVDVISQRQQKSRGYLKLGLKLRDETLSQTQIEEIARTLAELERNKDVGLRSIDWLGFGVKHRATTQFVKAVHVILLARRWKSLVLRKNSVTKTR